MPSNAFGNKQNIFRCSKRDSLVALCVRFLYPMRRNLILGAASLYKRNEFYTRYVLIVCTLRAIYISVI